MKIKYSGIMNTYNFESEQCETPCMCKTCLTARDAELARLRHHLQPEVKERIENYAIRKLPKNIQSLYSGKEPDCCEDCLMGCGEIIIGQDNIHCANPDCHCHYPKVEEKGLEDWEKEFDTKYCRKNRDPKHLGETMDKWFFPETLTPFEIKAFIRNLLSQQKQELIEKMEGILGYCGSWNMTDIIELRKKDKRSVSMRIDVFLEELKK